MTFLCMRSCSLLFAATLTVILSGCSKESAPATGGGGGGAVAINDPSGSYKLFSDPSVKRHPAADTVIGKGQPVEFEYDGSKGDGLSYQLYYVDQNGSVHPMSGGNIDSKGNGLFSAGITVFNSSAHQRPGFLELITVSGSGVSNGQITGKNVPLGMYAVRFEVAD